MKAPKRRTIDLIVLGAIIIGGLIAVHNAQAVTDWVYFLHYKPTPAISKLADDAGMSQQGRHLFYRFNPQILDGPSLTRMCGDRLGCTEGHTIYILQANDSVQYNRSVVTAAHEMLHVAYSRLSLKQQASVNTLLNTQIQAGISQNTKTDLSGYDTEDYINEAHSFIGTQEVDISQPLSQYYQRYFSDRTKTTTAYQNSPEAD